MGYIVHSGSIPNDQGGRHGDFVKDGSFIRAVVHYPDKTIHIITTEGETLYVETALVDDNIAVNTIRAAVSSKGSNHVVLYIFGFTPDSSDMAYRIVATDYVVAPPDYNV